MNRTVPPAPNLTILAGDLLAVAARRLVTELAAAPSWEPMARLKQALDAYECARMGQIVTEPDPQRMTIEAWEPAPETTRSIGHG